MYLTQGVQITTDEEGNLVLISYGISTARSQSNESIQAGKEKADLTAAANIRRFAGELVVASSNKEDTINSVELDDGSNQSVSEVFSGFTSKVDLVADKLKIKGITKIRDWSFTDPRSNQVVCGCVSIWSLKSADEAKPPIPGKPPGRGPGRSESVKSETH